MAEIFKLFQVKLDKGITSESTVQRMVIPQLLGLSIINATGTTAHRTSEVASVWASALQAAPAVTNKLFPTGQDNSQQIPLNGVMAPNNTVAGLLGQTLNFTLADVPAFLAFASHGRFSQGTFPSVPSFDAPANLDIGMNTFIVSRLMGSSGIYAKPGDISDSFSADQCSSINGTLCRTSSNGKLFYWSPTTHRQYELGSTKGNSVPALPELMDRIETQGYADSQLLVDGSYNCTAAGNAGAAIANLGKDALMSRDIESPHSSSTANAVPRSNDPDTELHSLLVSLGSASTPKPSSTTHSSSATASEFKTITPGSLYPTEISCRAAFDSAFYCQSLGGQFNNVYRYGTFRDCREQWKQFWFCVRTNRGFLGDREREGRVREHYKLRELKYRVGPSSEDVWKLRARMVEGAFDGDLEEDERKEREQTDS
ncbi:MAG: hypothetical protein Q9179_007056 [Wetmoreana sp. 5 TL-2023]